MKYKTVVVTINLNSDTRNEKMIKGRAASVTPMIGNQFKRGYMNSHTDSRGNQNQKRRTQHRQRL